MLLWLLWGEDIFDVSPFAARTGGQSIFFAKIGVKLVNRFTLGFHFYVDRIYLCCEVKQGPAIFKAERFDFLLLFCLNLYRQERGVTYCLNTLYTEHILEKEAIFFRVIHIIGSFMYL